MQGRSSRPVPAALRPQPKTLAPDELHVLFVVPDERIQRLLEERTYVVQPPKFAGHVKVHALDEKWAQDRGLLRSTVYFRQALLELGLVYPEDVEFVKTPLTLGWTD